ncbi:hypothetical protein FNZ56_02275 [Pseudoluteimonas lycopersici]|uniref:Uncharacterized protein n=1 Tax=Pseudoluteimonas lycopersici TaxID=1324796 RepID=A0A516V2M9_9GAMM|nr:hypothetical protein [Lysobacter lycopersici]QDQ72780.1 hypothetical protein FNZ56_02275 [Lysobacter lycopersici]
MRISGALFAALLGVLSPTAFAGDDGERFTSYAGFQLGIGTLDDVQRRLGATDAVHTGDAGDSETRLCYRVPGGNISFLSGEIGGETDLIGFSFSNVPRTHCATWPSTMPVPSMELAGLRLGMGKEEFSAAVGGEFHWENGEGNAYFESQRKPTDAERAAMPVDAMFDVDVSVIGSFVDGKLAEVEVWKVETY